MKPFTFPEKSENYFDTEEGKAEKFVLPVKKISFTLCNISKIDRIPNFSTQIA